MSEPSSVPPPPIPAEPPAPLPPGADRWTAGAFEDADPADEDILPGLARRIRSSVAFAVAVVCVVVWTLLLVAAAVGVLQSALGSGLAMGIGVGAVMMLPGAALLALAVDRLRHPPVFGGVPRAWNDPPWVYLVTVRGRHGGGILRRGSPGALHADAERLRIIWGRRYLRDRLLVVALAVAPSIWSPCPVLLNAAYVFLIAALLGLPRKRRMSVDLLPEEIRTIHVWGRDVSVLTTREGDDSRFDMRLTTFDRASVADHLRLALGDGVSIGVSP